MLQIHQIRKAEDVRIKFEFHSYLRGRERQRKEERNIQIDPQDRPRAFNDQLSQTDISPHEMFLKGMRHVKLCSMLEYQANKFILF